MRLSLVVALCFVSAAQAAIFGEDDIADVRTGSAWDQAARSTATAVLRTMLLPNGDGTHRIDVSKVEGLCKGERFAGETSISMSCSGFLVGPDLLATAGHCVYAVNTPTRTIRNEPGLACEAFKWVFDYQYDAQGKVNTDRVPESKIFGCKRIVFATQTSRSPFPDYALIQLDRPVPGRAPFKIGTGTPRLGDELHMIGNPYGTPKKVTTGGRVVLNNLKRETFITTLDAFEGNSGSAVFNRSKELVGILVGGTPSWNSYERSPGQCEVLNRCDENRLHCGRPDPDTSVFPEFQALGSEVQRIDPIRRLLGR